MELTDIEFTDAKQYLELLEKRSKMIELEYKREILD